jgi:hypothetical protein
MQFLILLFVLSFLPISYAGLATTECHDLANGLKVAGTQIFPDTNTKIAVVTRQNLVVTDISYEKTVVYTADGKTTINGKNCSTGPETADEIVRNTILNSFTNLSKFLKEHPVTEGTAPEHAAELRGAREKLIGLLRKCTSGQLENHVLKSAAVEALKQQGLTPSGASGGQH